MKAANISSEYNKGSKKKLEDLTLKDNFVFTRVMLDKEIALEIISILLEQELSDLEIVETEKTMNVKYGAKFIRLDVYIKSEDKIINVEMQVDNQGNIAMRSNYYKIVMGINNLASGEKYTELPEVYVIFVCLFDPFGLGKACYHFQTYDKENNVLLKDKTHTIIYDATKAGDVKQKKLREFLYYVNDEKIESEFTKKLDKAVELVKNNDIWKVDYMYYNAEMQDENSKGIAEGIEIGKTEGIEIGKINNARNLLDILDDETIANKIGLELEVVKKLREEK